MNIGYITSAYGRASDTFVRCEVTQLRDAGHAVHTYSIRRPAIDESADDAVKAEQSRTMYLVELGFPKLAWATVREFARSPRSVIAAAKLAWKLGPAGVKARLWQAAYVMEAAALARSMRENNVQHLHDHIGENSGTVAMLASTITGIPFSMTLHGPSVFYAPQQFGIAEKVHRGAFTVCISDFARSQCMVFVPTSGWEKLKIVRCGLQDEYLAAASSPVPADPRLVCVGRLCAEKGQTLLVRAVAALRDAGVMVQLDLIGDGPTRGELESLAAKLNVADRVRLVGWQTPAQIREAICNARAFVLPSFAEGLPVAIMEAFALGRPVISTHIAAIPELVEPGKTGWLVSPSALEPLIAAMRDAVTASPEQLTAMGEAGRRRIAERHVATVEVAKLATLFEESIAAQRREVPTSKPAAGQIQAELNPIA